MLFRQIWLDDGAKWQFSSLSLFLLTASAILLRMLYNRYSHPARKYPGPFIASCTRLWLVYIAWTGHVEEYYLQVHRRYGPVVRIGPNELSFAAPDAAIDIFRTGRGFHKTDFYAVFLPDGIKDIFTEIREKIHAKKKRYVVPPYSLAFVKRNTEQIESLLLKLLSKMDSTADRSQSMIFDLGTHLHYLVIDVLAQFAFGRSFGFLERGKDDDGFLEGISHAQYESSILGQIPLLERLTRSNPIWNMIPFLPKGNLALMPQTAESALREFQSNTINKSETPSCLLKSLLDTHQKDPETFGMQDVLAVSMGAVAAGSDTTASTMHSFCWHVLANSEVHRRLVAESMSADLSPMVQYDETISLPYFQACLKETMRLQPALAFNMTRTVPSAGSTVDGMHLEGGIRVAVSAWVVHRDESVFGPDTSTFNPQRWLDADAQQLKKMERCMFQFGGGSHICIGKHLALFELNKVLPQIFFRYEMKLVDPTSPLKHVTQLFYNQKGLRITLKRREIN